MFPSRSIKSIELLEKVFNAIPEEGISPSELREKIGVKNQRDIYAELALLVYLKKIERKGRGRNLKYLRKAKNLDLKRSLLLEEEPLKAYSYVLAKRKTRKDVAVWVYGSSVSSNLNRVSAIMKIGRLLDLIITFGGYKVKKDKAVEIFERLLEEIYFRKVEESGIEVVDLGTIRREIKNLIPDIDKKTFDELLLNLAKIREDLRLFPAPAADKKILEEGIQTNEGVLYHLKLEKSRWDLK